MKGVTACLLALPAVATAFSPAFQPSKSATIALRTRRATPLRAVALPSDATKADERGPLAEQDAWIANVDLDAFGRDVKALGKRLEKAQGEDDVNHIKKICLWSNTCAAVGLATMWMQPNPISVFALSLWTLSRWTTIAHHTNHGGYNNADKTRYFNSKGFAIGFKNRVTQWFDWMLPEAWNVEHNNLHHYRLSEADDPDLVERNLGIIRNAPLPRMFKYAAVGFLMCTWKWFYYAPNTYKELKIQQMRRAGKTFTEADGVDEAFTMKAFLDGTARKRNWFSFPEFFGKVIGPYLIGHFFLLPLPMLALSSAGVLPATAFQNSVVSLLLADVVTNIHAFIVIATNHAGKDLYTFSHGCAPNSGTFYMRQVASSANFRTGGDLNDFMHGWLNYQVEHHMWPQLSALSYQRSQPEVKALCEKHGIPYTQESVWIRLRKTVNIMTGKDTQRPYPPAYELEKDMMVWNSNKADSVAARKSVEEINSNILGDAKFKEVSEVTA